MNKKEFEQFVEESGKDILRYCRMIAYSNEDGNELYQDTMLKLLEKQESLDCEQNIKSYAISISILLLKNKKRKYAVRNKKALFVSLNDLADEDGESVAYNTGMRFKCEGDNIATVTYSIKRAAFWICEKHGNSIITDCTEYTGEYFNAGGFAPKGCKEDETDEENYDIRELSSYTLAYDKQESDTSIFAIKGIKKNKKIYELFESDFVDDNVEGITKLTDDVVITCTVTYNDGTSESKDIMTYLYPDIEEAKLVTDESGGIGYGAAYIGGEAGSMSYSKDDDTSYLQLLCGYADEKKLAETKELQFESITEARAQVKELTDKMGIPGELGKENITAFNSSDLNNIQSNMEQDSDYKDLLSAKKQQSRTFETDTEIYCFTYGIKIDGLQVYANDDPILQQTRDVLIARPVNIEVMISNRGIESVFVSGIMEEPDVCNANVDIIGEKEITEALNKRFGDVILTDEYKVTNIWMEYFPLLQNDSFTDIKLIPVWCLDFEVNGNGAEAGGYTIRINAITGDEIA